MDKQTAESESQPIVYIAPKPKKSWLKIVLLRLLFLPILLWDLVKYIGGKLFGKSFVQKFFYAQGSISACSLPPTRNVKTRLIRVETHDGATLDTLEINPYHEKSNIADQKYIIFFGGNDKSFEGSYASLEKDAERLSTCVIGFNYRNVGSSTKQATSTHDFVIDGIAQVQRLLDIGVQPEHIVLKGYSYGAAFATLVASHFHKNNQNINLFHDRSFSSLSKQGMAKLFPEDQKENQTTVGKIAIAILKPVARFILTVVGIELNVISAYLTLHDPHKEYMVVKSPKNRKPESEADATQTGAHTPPRDDSNIPHKASLHFALKHHRNKRKKFLNSHKKDAFKHQCHSRKMSTERYDENGHFTDHSNLKNRHNKTANEFFDEFFHRCTN
ncbi:MAG: hypothetical protein V4490_06030, partial [Pseudomonadota bacterium]